MYRTWDHNWKEYLMDGLHCNPWLSSTKWQPVSDSWSARSRTARWWGRGQEGSKWGTKPCQGQSPSGPWPSALGAWYSVSSHEGAIELFPTFHWKDVKLKALVWIFIYHAYRLGFSQTESMILAVEVEQPRWSLQHLRTSVLFWWCSSISQLVVI